MTQQVKVKANNTKCCWKDCTKKADAFFGIDKEKAELVPLCREHINATKNPTYVEVPELTYEVGIDLAKKDVV